MLRSLRSRRAKLIQIREVAYRAARGVEPFAFVAERLAICPLSELLWLDAVAGAAVDVVVVHVRVGRVPLLHAPENARSLLQMVRCRADQAFIFVHGHSLLLTSLPFVAH